MFEVFFGGEQGLIDSAGLVVCFDESDLGEVQGGIESQGELILVDGLVGVAGLLVAASEPVVRGGVFMVGIEALFQQDHGGVIFLVFDIDLGFLV